MVSEDDGDERAALEDALSPGVVVTRLEKRVTMVFVRGVVFRRIAGRRMGAGGEGRTTDGRCGLITSNKARMFGFSTATRAIRDLLVEGASSLESAEALRLTDGFGTVDRG